MNKAIIGSVAVAATLGLAGCKSTSINNAPLTTSSVNNSPSASAEAPASTAPPQVAHIGSTVSVVSGDESANVTITKVLDPATSADQYMTPDHGKRFVAVVLTIKATSTATVSGDANNDVNVIGSDNQTYTADFDTVQGCTNFNNGSFSLSSDESTTGCVVFQVPTGVSVVKVRFEPAGGLPGGKLGEWINP